ncbi:DNA-directed DNA polymerase [Aphelenchoides besseyi]|nr:DNA-directed DNA polymerase [Aphelenchoides besseyi]
MSISSKNGDKLIFKDSINYFPRALATLPAMFGLPEAKGHFPHLWNNPRDLQRVESQLPPLDAYEPNRLTAAAREELRQWWEANRHQTFNVKEELVRYCVQDVVVLRQACVEFRNVLRTQQNLDPFQRASTLPNLALEVFTKRFMPPNTIVNIPEEGFAKRDRQSVIALRYFRLRELENPSIVVRDATWFVGEKRFGHNGLKRIDGVVGVFSFGPPLPLQVVDRATGQELSAIEFMGCYFHGCNECYRSDAMRLAHGVPAVILRNRTEQRIRELRQKFGDVQVVRECHFRRELSANPQRRALYEQTSVEEPLNPRSDCLRGGRTEAFKVYHCCVPGEQLIHIDVVSLYPYVMKRREFPVGMPTVLTRESFIGQQWTTATQNRWRGLFKVRVEPPVPPTTRYVQLHYRTRAGRFTFPLCGPCADADSPPRSCPHKTARERAWIGGYTHVALNRALSLGYRVTEIFEVYHWDEWASMERGNSLFAGYMDYFLKEKVEASGWPKSCVTPADKQRFLDDYERHEGIRLDPQRIELNAGRRNTGKMLNNSLWGKMCQNPIETMIDYATNDDEFLRLINDDRYELMSIEPVAPDKERLQRRLRREFVRTPRSNNVPVACFVTDHARDVLFDYMQQVQGEILYMDTDSLIYVLEEGQRRVPEGDRLGQMTSERPGRRIIEFISGGPKNYGYRHADEKTGQDECAFIKVRGFTLNYTTAQLLNYETARNMILRRFTPFDFDDNEEPHIVVPYHRITRNARAELHNQHMNKRYGLVYNKGFVRSDLRIHPFGCLCALCQ